MAFELVVSMLRMPNFVVKEIEPLEELLLLILLLFICFLCLTSFLGILLIWWCCYSLIHEGKLKSVCDKLDIWLSGGLRAVVVAGTLAKGAVIFAC